MTMDLSELRKLLPFYVAGTLSETEKRAVGKALSESAELRDELKFWRKAQLPARAYSVAHPSAKEILDYVEGRSTESERGTFERHVQACFDCQNEIALIRETYPKALHQEQRSGIRSLGIREMLKEFSRSLKNRYVVSFAVVTAVFCAALVYFFWGREETVPSIAQRPPTQVQRRVELLLEYSPQVRSYQQDQQPRLNPSGFDFVECAIYVPRSIESVRYSVSLISPLGVTTKFSDSPKPLHHNESLDMIHISIETSYFSEQGEYRLVATEQLPSFSGLTPESHVYSFVVASPR